MGAALHLAHAQEIPGKKQRRKGGGGGGDSPAERFSNFVKRIYADDRASAEVRSLLIALAHAVTFGPPGEERKVWDRAAKALGRPARARSRAHLNELVRMDVPRYEPPSHWEEKRYCVGPRFRPHPGGPENFRNVEKVCGAPGKERAVERLPGTGWLKFHWYCDRHRAQLHAARRQLEEPNSMAPMRPTPNAGGLMPVYFDSDWVTVYRQALGNEQWEAPVHGVCADDWHAPPEKDVAPEKGRLRLIVGGYEDGAKV